MQPTDVVYIKSLFRKYGLGFNKSLGQNFLVNPSVPERIAEECGAGPSDGIIEIGPGAGALTIELCRRYRKVAAVEIDKKLIPLLEEVLLGFDNLVLINEDILKCDIRSLLEGYFSGMKVSICANLPYYITTPILMYLLESGCRFDNITVMVQKEVAARLCAEPGSSDYGAVTAAVSYYGKAKRLFTVSSGNFLPAPKVDSAVVRISMFDKPSTAVLDKKMFFRVIKGAFAQRRKTLTNSLSSEFTEIGKERLSCIISECGIDSGIRGECLSVNDFGAIADRIYLSLKK